MRFVNRLGLAPVPVHFRLLHRAQLIDSPHPARVVVLRILLALRRLLRVPLLRLLEVQPLLYMRQGLVVRLIQRLQQPRELGRRLLLEGVHRRLLSPELDLPQRRGLLLPVLERLQPLLEFLDVESAVVVEVVEPESVRYLFLLPQDTRHLVAAARPTDL